MCQSDGLIFLWVTARALLSIGRECLRAWGYRLAGEIVWVKSDQLGRLRRGKASGHWLNHSKEHWYAFSDRFCCHKHSLCRSLIGSKGSVSFVRPSGETDVIVAPSREMSRKPDEIYRLIDRLAPHTRRVELFGRPHNVWPGWLTLGNQLGDSYTVDPRLAEARRWAERHPPAAKD